MKRFLLISVLVWIVSLRMCIDALAQSPPSSVPPTSQKAAYTAWITGDTADVKTQPMGGIVLAGGSTDVDSAMRWLLRRSNGGDVVIIRASGSDGYNKYLFSQLGERVNSVETILVNTRELASQPDIVRKVRQAEAIFFAGGDQANYVNFYRNTPLADAFNERIRAGAVLGGTSAGCAILGQQYFSAQGGSVTSEEALADPFDKRVTLGNRDFLMLPLLADVLTDQHYTARNRQGRHLVFLARALTDWNIRTRGIGVDEKTAVCVSPDGTARVFGQGNAYFLASASAKPDRIQVGQPLNWSGTGQAVRVTVVPGSATGTTGFDVKTFRGVDSLKTAYWSVENGVFRATSAH
jgi:cyanophycinase